MDALSTDFFDEPWFELQRVRFTPEETESQVEGLISLLGLKPGQAVLDVPVGTGRIAVRLAQRGLDVTGVDLHEAVLADARAAALAAEVPLLLQRRDMRDLPWQGHFDAVLNLWGSFGYFGDEGDLAFAAAAARALKPGGRLLIEGPSAEVLFAHWQPRRWARWGEALVLEASVYEPKTGLVRSEWTIIRDGQQVVRHLQVRLYSGAELARLLREAGFRDLELYGGWDGRPYEVGASRMMAVATR